MAKLVKLESAADMLFTPPAGYVTSTIGTDEAGLITELIKKSDGTITSIGGGGSGSSDGYVAVEVDGVLKAQKLAFDGTTASVNGAPEAIGTVGIFNTGVNEPEYKGSTIIKGTSTFYKCASVDSTTKTWTGYEALVNGDTGVWSFSETLTEDLPYNKIIPQVGKVYDNECTFQASGFDQGLLIPSDGLVFYAPLSQDYVDTVYNATIVTTNGSFSEYGGKTALLLTGGYVEWTGGSSIPSGNTAMSIFGLINGINISEWRYFFGFSGGNNSNAFGLNSYDSEIAARIGSDWYAGSSISTDTWYSMALTRDASGNVSFYLNGISENTTTASNSVGNSIITVGANGGEGYIHNFNGYISDFAIYNRALTAEEVLSMHNNLMPQ